MSVRALCILVLLMSLVSLGAADGRDARRVDLLIAAMTDHRRSINQRAMAALVDRGESVLPDLAILATDGNHEVRGRVAKVLGHIGGSRAFAIVHKLASDQHQLVRELAVLAMGGCDVPEALPAIRPYLRDPQPSIRESAALALGAMRRPEAIIDLAGWPEAGGGLAGLQLKRGSEGERQLKGIRVAMQSGLLAIVRNSRAVPHIIKALKELKGSAQEALIEATWEIGDPRLCPILDELARTSHYDARVMACIGLGVNGDSRCLATLVDAAVKERGDLARHGALALRRLTGYKAGPGKAWELWWADRRASSEQLAERDAFIAQLHDLDYQVSRKDLARFTPAELWPLVVGIRGDGARHWSRRAWAVLKADDPERWTDEFFTRYDKATDERRQVEIVQIVSAIGGSRSREELQLRLSDLDATVPRGPTAGAGSLRLALRMALGLIDPGPIVEDRRKTRN